MSEKVGSLPVKLFAGAVCGTSIALVYISLVWLGWFIPLGRPGSHIPTVEQIIQEWTAANNTGGRSAEELHAAAENTQAAYVWASRVVYKPLEVIMLTSACLVAAWFAALYARAQDVGDAVAEGRDASAAGGSLTLPSIVGLVVGGAVMWFLIYALLVAPGGEAHDAHGAADHGKAAPTAAHDEKKGHDEQKAHGESKAGHEAPAKGHEAPAKSHETHEAGSTFGEWLAHNETLAEIMMFFAAMIAASVAAILTPRGAAGPKPETLSLGASH